MSNSEYVQVEHAEAFDLRTVDSMEVEGEDDTRSSNAVVSDRGWIKSGPHDGPQATVDNELEEPANCSLIQACALLTTRVGTLEEEIRELKRCAATLQQLRNNRTMTLWHIVWAHWKGR